MSAKQAETLQQLKESIRKLLMYSQYLQKYGDQSFQASLDAKKEAEKLLTHKNFLVDRVQTQQEDIMILQKQLLWERRENEKLRVLNKLDISYISSVEFQRPESTFSSGSEGMGEEESEESDSKVGSYYSQDQEVELV